MSRRPVVVTQLDGEPVEMNVSIDMVKHGLLVAPAVLGLAGLVWGSAGAWSAAMAMSLVLVNFALSAVLISTTARISLGLMMGATLFGYLLRLGLILMVVLLVRDASWISRPALGATIIVTHLGLLLWELKYVAITLAHPGLRPARP
ncbi:MAG: ATP synthase subunit I [Ilumatobacteraceae bacterium]